jgi:hypothetical protein
VCACVGVCVSVKSCLSLLTDTSRFLGSKIMADELSGWVAGWLGVWVAGWLGVWVAGCLGSWLGVWVAGWVSG